MIPYRELRTLFLDVGNTLISIDFAWVQQELARLGVDCTPEALERAEAASRPAVSARLAAGMRPEGDDTFRFHLSAVLARLPVDAERIAGLADELLPILHQPGRSMRLWSRLIPGVPESLQRLRDAGLLLVAVSNADGTVEQGLRDQGLREHFEAVLDSTVVGSAKPDRGIFDRAIEASGADPRRTLHVGDIYAVDVIGARGAGLHALLLDPYDDWPGVDCERAESLPALADRILAAR